LGNQPAIITIGKNLCTRQTSHNAPGPLPATSSQPARQRAKATAEHHADMPESRCMSQSSQKPGTIVANSVKQSESNQRNPICCQSARSDCMLCVCFLSIVLEKSAKVRKRTEAHIPKSVNTT